MDAERKALFRIRRSEAEQKELLRIRREAEYGRGANAFQTLGMLDLLAAAEERVENLAAESKDRAEAWGDAVIDRDRLRDLLSRAYDIATSGKPAQDVPGEIAALLADEVGDGR